MDLLPGVEILTHLKKGFDLQERKRIVPGGDGGQIDRWQLQQTDN